MCLVFRPERCLEILSRFVQRLPPFATVLRGTLLHRGSHKYCCCCTVFQLHSCSKIKTQPNKAGEPLRDVGHCLARAPSFRVPSACIVHHHIVRIAVATQSQLQGSTSPPSSPFLTPRSSLLLLSASKLLRLCRASVALFFAGGSSSAVPRTGERLRVSRVVQPHYATFAFGTPATCWHGLSTRHVTPPGIGFCLFIVFGRPPLLLLSGVGVGHTSADVRFLLSGDHCARDSTLTAGTCPSR